MRRRLRNPRTPHARSPTPPTIPDAFPPRPDNNNPRLRHPRQVKAPAAGGRGSVRVLRVTRAGMDAGGFAKPAGGEARHSQARPTSELPQASRQRLSRLSSEFQIVVTHFVPGASGRGLVRSQQAGRRPAVSFTSPPRLREGGEVKETAELDRTSSAGSRDFWRSESPEAAPCTPPRQPSCICLPLEGGGSTHESSDYASSLRVSPCTNTNAHSLDHRRSNGCLASGHCPGSSAPRRRSLRSLGVRPCPVPAAPESTCARWPDQRQTLLAEQQHGPSTRHSEPSAHQGASRWHFARP